MAYPVAYVENAPACWCVFCKGSCCYAKQSVILNTYAFYIFRTQTFMHTHITLIVQNEYGR